MRACDWLGWLERAERKVTQRGVEGCVRDVRSMGKCNGKLVLVQGEDE